VSIVQEIGLLVGLRGVRSAPQHDRPGGATVDTYYVELEEAEGRFIGTVQAVPGLLVFGSTVDEVLERARSAIEFHAGRPFAMHKPIGVAEPADTVLHLMAQT
jgi:predicted RNase H-like HicB family nuclease